MKLRQFRIHWDNGNRVSCFFLKTRPQAESIAKQYLNVVKVMANHTRTYFLIRPDFDGKIYCAALVSE